MENIIKDIKHYSKYLMLAMQDLEEFINANKENDKEKKKKLYFRKYYRKYYNNHSYNHLFKFNNYTFFFFNRFYFCNNQMNIF